MRRKTILFVSLGAIAIAVAGGAMALISVDFGRFKSQFVEQIEHATGRSLVVGDMSFNVLPMPTLSIKNVTLANALSSASPPMIRVGDISARFALLPLVFGGPLRISRLRINDVEINLETDAGGHGNWLLGGLATDSGKPPSAAAKGNAALDLPVIGDTIAQEVTITYRDGRTGTTSTASLDSIKLIGHADASAFNFDLRIDGNGLAATPLAASERLSSMEYHLAATVSGDRDKPILLKSIHGNFGASSVSGEGSLALNGPRPILTAALDVPAIDLLHAEAMAGRATKPSGDLVFSSNPLALPLDALRAFDGDLMLKVGAIASGGATMEKVWAHFNLDDGNLLIAPFSTDIGGSHVTGKASLSARASLPVVVVNLEAKEIDVGKVVTAISGDDLIDGKGDWTIAARGQGDSVRAIMASLDGNSSLVVGKGLIKHQLVDLVGADVFRDAFAVDEGKQTANLNCMVARFDIRKGLATAHGLLMDTHDVTLSGHGTVDFASERIALEMTPRPKERSLLALPITVEIGGTLAHPTARSDNVLIAKDVAVDIASGAVSPALALAPILLGSGGARNPCLIALGHVVAANSSSALARPGAEPAKKDNGAGTALDDIGRSIDDFFEK